jgi:hypothetical protein
MTYPEDLKDLHEAGSHLAHDERRHIAVSLYYLVTRFETEHEKSRAIRYMHEWLKRYEIFDLEARSARDFSDAKS